MKLFSLLALLYLVLATGTAFATEASYEKSFAKGTAELNGANYEAAIKEFQSALNDKPDDPEATLYLGIAYSRTRNEKAEAVLKRALSQDPANPLTNLELGSYYLNEGVYTEAEDYFENILTIAPGTDYATVAKGLLFKVEEQKKDKRWKIAFLGGMQYDSNVILNADNSPLPTEITRKSDWRAILSPSVSFLPVKSEQTEVEVGYSLYQSLHVKLTEFNITQNVVELKGKYQVTPHLTAALGYSFEYLFLGGYAYDYAHTLSPTLTFTTEAGYSTMVDYRYRDTTFKDSDNGARSGGNHTFGLLQKLPFGSEIMARFGYSHDKENTRGNEWQSSANTGLAGLTVMAPLAVAVDVSGEFASKKYPDFSGGSRDDKTYTASIAAIKALSKNYGIVLSNTYSRNDSNNSLFQYTRNIISLIINARY